MQRLLGISTILLLAGLPGCAIEVPSPETGPSETGPGEVEFRLAGPGGAALLIPVEINGSGPFDFVLDTGATLTCLDEGLVEQLGIEQQGGEVGVGVGVEQAGRVSLVEIDSLQVGTATASGLRACVINLGQMQQLGVKIEGLVGLNFLKNFRVTIDFERSVVSLEK